MSKSFKNTITAIAAIDVFTKTLSDAVKTHQSIRDGFSNQNVVLLQLTVRKILHLTRLSQTYCKGSISYEEYKEISIALKSHASAFANRNPQLDLVSFISFSLIGLGIVLSNFENVPAKNKKHAKIAAFRSMIDEGLNLIRFFDPSITELENIPSYSFGEKLWKYIFEG